MRPEYPRLGRQFPKSIAEFNGELRLSITESAIAFGIVRGTCNLPTRLHPCLPTPSETSKGCICQGADQEEHHDRRSPSLVRTECSTKVAVLSLAPQSTLTMLPESVRRYRHVLSSDRLPRSHYFRKSSLESAVFLSPLPDSSTLLKPVPISNYLRKGVLSATVSVESKYVRRYYRRQLVGFSQYHRERDQSEPETGYVQGCRQ